ncbi:MAG TPA: acyl-CoA desaturase [Chloroflexota bacterium]|nr:acyl-CoA desaturase [Chloroflexota bacterium]
MPEATVTSRRVNWLNVVFLMGTALVAAVGTPWYLVTHGLGWPEAITFVALWLAVGVSVTGGYHRLFAHKTYRAAWPVRLFYIVFGAGALENSVLNWTADHRVHHSEVDHDRDPYNIQKGFWWAHMGWIFFENETPPVTVVRDLLEDPLVRWQARWYVPIGLGVAFGIPLIVGLATGHVLGCLLIGGVLRVVVSHHGTFFINSLCHMVGRQPYSREHSARDSSVMAVLAFGEGYHNYHHIFAHDYRNGVRWWQWDPTKWLIAGLQVVGLTSRLKRTPDFQIQRALLAMQFKRTQEKLANMSHTGQTQIEAIRQRIAHEYETFHAAVAEWAKVKEQWLEEKARAVIQHWEHTSFQEQLAEIERRLHLQRRRMRVLHAQLA